MAMKDLNKKNNEFLGNDRGSGRGNRCDLSFHLRLKARINVGILVLIESRSLHSKYENIIVP